MNTNVNAIANSYLPGEIDMRRGHALRSYFKRQSRRQVRHRLAAELDRDLSHHLKEASEIMAMNNRSAVTAAPTAKIIAFPSQEQRAGRLVLVMRKASRSPYERKQVLIERLAA